VLFTTVAGIGPWNCNVAPVRLVPESTIVVPTGPLLGVTPVIVGALDVTMNGVLVDPLGVVTWSVFGPMARLIGTVMTI
jgi:hypothetical protein